MLPRNVDATAPERRKPEDGVRVAGLLDLFKLLELLGNKQTAKTANDIRRSVKTAPDDLYREHAAWTGDYVDGHVAEAVAWAEANHALKVTALTAEDAAALRATAEPLIQGYVARMAAKGIDGQAVVDFIRGKR